MEALCHVKAVYRYGNECSSRTQVFGWFKTFKEGRETTNDDPRPELLSTSTTDDNIEKIGTLIHENRCLSTQALAERTGMGIEILDRFCIANLTCTRFARKLGQNSSLLTEKSQKRTFAQTF